MHTSRNRCSLIYHCMFCLICDVAIQFPTLTNTTPSSLLARNSFDLIVGKLSPTLKVCDSCNHNHIGIMLQKRAWRHIWACIEKIIQAKAKLVEIEESKGENESSNEILGCRRNIQVALFSSIPNSFTLPLEWSLSWCTALEAISSSHFAASFPLFVLLSSFLLLRIQIYFTKQQKIKI